MDAQELLEKFLRGEEPLSAREMDVLGRWAEGRSSDSDDLLLLSRLSQARRYREGLMRFKAACRPAQPAAAGHSRLWPAVAAAALLAAVALPLARAGSDSGVEQWHCNETCTLQSVELLLEQAITTP